MGRCVGITVYKGWSRVGARTGTLKNPTKCVWRWEPDRRSNFFFSPPAHLCAVTYMTEISLIVTLNNQFTSPHLLSISNPDFEKYLGQMYPAEFEIKDTTESNTSASYLDLLLSIESDGQLRTSLYDKRDDFNFHITNFPFLSSNIQSSPAYGVFISHLIRYARVCSSYECFIVRAARLSSKLLGQGYVMELLKSSLRKFYGRYGDFIKHYEVSLSQMLHDILGHDHIQ